MTQRLARACAAHRWRTIGVRLVAIVLGVVGAAAGLGDLTTEGRVTDNPDSLKAKGLIEERVPHRQAATELVVVRSQRLTVDKPAYRAEVRRLAAMGRSTGEVAGALIYDQRPDPRLVSADRHALLIPIQLRDESVSGVGKLVDAVQAADGRDGFDVSITGKWTLSRDLSELSQSDPKSGELRSASRPPSSCRPGLRRPGGRRAAARCGRSPSGHRAAAERRGAQDRTGRGALLVSRLAPSAAPAGRWPRAAAGPPSTRRAPSALAPTNAARMAAYRGELRSGRRAHRSGFPHP